MHMDENATRKRTTRACDECRKTKSRCEYSVPPNESTSSCRNCLLTKTECTFLEPTHKRGPPKGYLSALERRLHDAEALLGVIISSDDLRATTLVADLSKDFLAHSIITRITNSAVGPAGRDILRNSDSVDHLRKLSDDSRWRQMNAFDVTTLDSNGHLVFSTPNHMWQDYLSLRLSLMSRSRYQAPLNVPSQVPSSSISCPPPRRTTSKLSHLDTALRFPISGALDIAEPISMLANASVTNLSSLSLAETVALPDMSRNEESDSGVSIPLHLDGIAADEKDNTNAPYSLAHLLDLDGCPDPRLDLTYGMQTVPSFPLGFEKPYKVEGIKSDNPEAEAKARRVERRNQPPHSGRDWFERA